MTKVELTEYVSSAQKGDKSALEEIYLFTRSFVFNRIRNTVTNVDDAEDILQSCYLTVVEKLGELKDPNSFERWFNVIVTNKIKDYQKKSKPVLLNDDDLNVFDSIPEINSDYIPHESVERKDNIETVHNIVDKLSEKKKQSITMHYFENKSVAEIADELKISENTVKSRLHSGREEIIRTAKKRSKKLLLTIFILLILLLATALCVISSQKYSYNMEYELFGDYGELYFINQSDDDSRPLTLEKGYSPEYIPEGYSFSCLDVSEAGQSFTFINDNDDYFMFHQVTISKNWTIDTKDADIRYIYVDGKKILCKYSDNSHYKCIWTDDEYIFSFSITEPISDEEILKVIRGIKQVQ